MKKILNKIFRVLIAIGEARASYVTRQKIYW